jgi:hypothetical protein
MQSEENAKLLACLNKNDRDVQSCASMKENIEGAALKVKLDHARANG